MKLLLFFIFITISLQAQSKNVSLVLPWKHQFQFAGYYVAKELGFYEKAGLDVNIKEYHTGIDVSQDVSTGKYDFGVGHSFLLLDKLNKYSNIIFLNAIHQSSPMVLLSKKRTDIKTLGDVVGKKVMISKEQISGASINAMLFSANIKQGSYEIVNTTFNPVDLINGHADFMTAYLSNEPYTLNQKGVEYTIFDPKDFGYDFYSDILFTSHTMLKNSPKDVEAFQIASLQGWEYAYKHVDEAVEIILKKYNTQSRTKKALEFEAKILRELAFNNGISFGNINPIKLKEITTAYRLLGLVDSNSKVNFNSFIYKPAKNYKFGNGNFKKLKKNYFEFIHNFYFKLFIFIFIIIILTGLYFRYKTTKILKERTAELELQNKIFNDNICSSKTDINGNITYVSDAFCDLSGYTREELLSKKHNILKDEDTTPEIYKDLWLTISSAHTWRGEIKNVKKDGSEYWINTIISPILDSESHIIGYESIIQDVTLKKVLKEFNEKLESEVKKQTENLEKLAITDKLTGLYNRVKIDDDLDSNYKYFKEFDENFAVIIIDIDHFKNVNDTHGHQVGDKVLIEISKLLRRNVRSTDIVGRWGGEEFMIICPKTDLKAAYSIAQNIRSKVELYNFSRVGILTISAGVSDIASNKNLDAMINKADALLYEVKNSGRNSVKI